MKAIYFITLLLLAPFTLGYTDDDVLNMGYEPVLNWNDGPSSIQNVTAQGTGHSQMSASEASGRAYIAMETDKANIEAGLGPNQTITWGQPYMKSFYFPGPELFVVRWFVDGTIQ